METQKMSWYESTCRSIDTLFWLSPIGFVLNRERHYDYWDILYLKTSE